tara:strand:- start:307 stop:975 length:669 start_codon:yes stop_codon:yes gene_type:complete
LINLTDISFIVPVRKGSVRVKNKNIRKFHRSSLLEIKLKQIRSNFPNNPLLLSSDCNESLIKGKKYGCIIDKRSKKYCSSSIPMREVYSYLASKIDTKYICYLNVTSPLLKDKSLMEAIKIFIQNYPKYKSLASVSIIKEYLWYKNKAINYDPLNHPKSQNLPDYFSVNFGVNIISTKVMRDEKLLVKKGFLPYRLTFPENIDIDTEDDFFLAEYFYKRNFK